MHGEGTGGHPTKRRELFKLLGGLFFSFFFFSSLSEIIVRSGLPLQPPRKWRMSLGQGPSSPFPF